jgi:hypothetical protein
LGCLLLNKLTFIVLLASLLNRVEPLFFAEAPLLFAQSAGFGKGQTTPKTVGPNWLTMRNVDEYGDLMVL